MDKLTTREKRRLRRYSCAWCDQRLDLDGCGAFWEKCSEETRDKRRRDCLADMRPPRNPVVTQGERS